MMPTKLLLYCGIAASLLYAAMNIIIPIYWEDYSISSQTVSELSAIDSPTRRIWVPPGVVYTLLMMLFGWGVLKSATDNRRLQAAGLLMLVYGFIGIYWPPMHLREVLAAGGGTMTDTLHIAWTIVTVLLMTLSIGFGGTALGGTFRQYSIATIVLLFIFGGLTSRNAAAIEKDLPTPLMGVWERLNIGVFLLWVIVFAIVLLKEKNDLMTAKTQK